MFLALQCIEQMNIMLEDFYPIFDLFNQQKVLQFQWVHRSLNFKTTYPPRETYCILELKAIFKKNEKLHL